jgi:hypothetical protein
MPCRGKGIVLCLVAAAALLASLLVTGCRPEVPAAPAEPDIDPELGVAALPAPSDKTAGALIEKAYALKQDGHNGAALAALTQACAAIAKTAGEKSPDYGSCLDDEASVHVRMGHADRARELYTRALGILDADKGSDPRLVHGVRIRLQEMDLMAAKGIACAEPAEPPSQSELPYFPDTAAMQEALGTLNPYVAVCADGTPEAVTVRVIITGDGRAIRAEARGLHADTPLGGCVLEKLLAAIPKAKLPRFRACFRGFTYPFMVGKHESRQAP